MLLDKPDLRVQLILPPFLLDQWKRELTQKFRVHDFTRAHVRFSRDDEPIAWDAADLVVVDEAHNLARMSVSADPDLAARFERLREVALASPRLLMLSATPALHNEDAFLAMLKLLDPAVYADTTAEQLRSRLEARAGLGRVFLGLQPGLPGVLLKGRLTEIEAVVPRRRRGRRDRRARPGVGGRAGQGRDGIADPGTAHARRRGVPRPPPDASHPPDDGAGRHLPGVRPSSARASSSWTRLRATKSQRRSTGGGNRPWQRPRATRRR